MDRTSPHRPRHTFAPPATHSVFRTIRVRSSDSAYVYFVLESNEGTVSYSTLPHQAGDLHRDLELRIPPQMTDDCDRILNLLREQGIEIE